MKKEQSFEEVWKEMDELDPLTPQTKKEVKEIIDVKVMDKPHMRLSPS